MKMIVPFNYKAAYYERRSPTANYVRLPGEALVEIPELSGDEATPAFVVADASGIGRTMTPIEGRARRVIQHGLRFWREIGTPERATVLMRPPIGPGEHLRIDLSFDNPFHPPEEVAYTGGGDHFWHRGDSGPEWPFWDRSFSTKDRAALEKGSTKGIRKWDDDGGRALEAMARRVASDRLRVVSGRVFQVCDEPCFAVRVRGGQAVVGITTISAARESWRRSWYASSRGRQSGIADRLPFDALYRITRYDDAVNHAATLASRLGLGGVRVAARCKVVNPELALFADDWLAVDRARWVAQTVVPSRLSSLSRETGLGWIDARDALAASGGLPTDAVAEALGRVGRSFPGWKGYGSNDGPFGPASIAYSNPSSGCDAAVGMQALLRDSCISAAERWESRPRDGLEWTPGGGIPDPAEGAPITVRELATAEHVRDAAVALGNPPLADWSTAAANGTHRILLALREGVPVCAGCFPDEGDPEFAGFSGRDGDAVNAILAAAVGSSSVTPAF